MSFSTARALRLCALRGALSRPVIEAQTAAMRDPRPRDEAGPRPPLQLAAALTGERTEDGAGRVHRRASR